MHSGVLAAGAAGAYRGTAWSVRGCMRDVEEEHTLVHVLSAVLRANAEFDNNESEVSSLSNRRSSAYVRVVLLGVLRRVLSLWA